MLSLLATPLLGVFTPLFLIGSDLRFGATTGKYPCPLALITGPAGHNEIVHTIFAPVRAGFYVVDFKGAVGISAVHTAPTVPLINFLPQRIRKAVWLRCCWLCMMK